MHDETLKLELF